MTQRLRFADLFAGLGGFHVGLSRLGCRCVFACEIDEDLRRLYAANFGVTPAGDIRAVSASEVPRFDVLCAGFPCQPFSKAGEQRGTDCPESGDLFRGHVLRLIRFHKPRYVLLENVPNLARHEGGRTWAAMESALRGLGYHVKTSLLSPHRFGIPQVRDRLFVVASLSTLDQFSWPRPDSDAPRIQSVLDPSPERARRLSEVARECLDVWQDFLDRSKHLSNLPSFPIWAMEFGATYPFEELTPYVLTSRQLGQIRGSFGQRLSELPPDMRMEGLPPYARSAVSSFPKWKQDFIRQNREFYAMNKLWIDPWLPSLKKFPPSLQKFEWNCKGWKRDVWSMVIQFRASGVRVKKPTTAPSLVAMTTTQVPIIGWERRYMTPRECARLQDLGSLDYLPVSLSGSYRALGNAVNARLVELVAANLLSADRSRGGRRGAVASEALNAWGD